MNATDAMQIIVKGFNNITPTGDVALHFGVGPDKVGAVRNMTMAHAENLLVRESDGGLMRRSRSRRTGQ